jgi:AraC-like DNA-binding protein
MRGCRGAGSRSATVRLSPGRTSCSGWSSGRRGSGKVPTGWSSRRRSAVLGEAVESGLRLGAGAGRERGATAAGRADLVEATKELLAVRLSERLTLAEIARQVHSSPFHLARVFRARTGFSIHGYRNQLRLRSSLEQLFEPDADLGLLARRLGYASHSHFTVSFRRAFGRPPSAVRRAGRARDLAELRTIVEAPLAVAS